MGYDVHLTRKEDWFEDGPDILLQEWKEYIEGDEEMRLDGFAEAETPDGVLRIESEGLAVWTSWSQHEKDGNMAWMDYDRGNITVKNPDTEILKKMFVIAQSLDAKVQGDDGEAYDADGQPDQEVFQPFKFSERKWWQFWKSF